MSKSAFGKILALVLALSVLLCSLPVAATNLDEGEEAVSSLPVDDADGGVTAPEDAEAPESTLPEPPESLALPEEAPDDAVSAPIAEEETPAAEESLPAPAANEEAAAGMAAEGDPGEGLLYAEGEVLVVFEDGISPQDAYAALDACSALPEDVLDGGALAGGDALLMQVAEGAGVAQVVDALNGHPAVAHAQPNYIYTLPEYEAVEATVVEAMGAAATLATTTINDKYGPNQWYLNTIGVKDAWDFQKTSGTVRVAVVDTGVDPSHPDLINNLDMTYAWDQVNNTALTGDVDKYGHGSHVAGIIAAEANNSIGVAGVSWNAKIVPINVFKTVSGGTLAYTNTIIDAIERLLSVPDLKVINFSLGGSVYDKLYHAAIQKATAQGIACICAAGNENISTKMYPSDFEESISVTALDKNSVRAEYSNFNEHKDIAAPGSNIISTGKGGKYLYMSGTSMATPVVAGVAALLYAQDPTITVDILKEILYKTADDLGAAGRDDYYGHGRVNALAAIKYSLDTSPTAVELDVYTQSLAIGTSFTLEATVLPSFAENTNVSWSSSAPTVATVSGGVVTAVSAGTATITVTTEDGGISAACVVTCSATGAAGEGDAPALALNQEAKTIKPKGSLTLKATDASGAAVDPTTLIWTSSNPKVATVDKNGKVKATGKKGTATITATTADGAEAAKCVITIGTPVSKVKLSKKTAKLAKGKKVTLKATISPAKATNKKVTWSSSNKKVATVNSKGVVKAVGVGKATITVKTKDGAKKATCKITVKKK